ncbi:DUF948 domain-containing protein [Sporosarcina sp. CAU 1771]
MYINIAVFLVAVAFAITSIYMITILIRITSLFSTLGNTISATEGKLDQMVIEVENLVVETEQTASDVKEKLQATDGLFASIQNVGQATSIASGKLLSVTKTYSKSESAGGLKPFVRAIQFSEFTSTLFDSWMKGKKYSKK